LLFVHIHRLAAGRSSLSRVICHYRGTGTMPPIHGESTEFFPGILANVRVEPADMLRAPTKQLRQ
jgi:hypothetical protein